MIDVNRLHPADERPALWFLSSEIGVSVKSSMLYCGLQLSFDDDPKRQTPNV
ncbi:MAG: hypothetical protein ING29_18670 [Azospirillum sp.]|nr:hypothetical protein [Azospirillum sp.]